MGMSGIYHEVTPPEVIAARRRADEMTTLHGGIRTVWRVWGEGEPLVLLHGGHGSWMHWLRNVDALSKRFRVIAADMPSYGDSDALDRQAGIEDYARHVASGIEQILREEPATLCGFSFGGVVAGHVAGLMEGAIARVVFVGTGGLALTRPSMEEMVRWRGVSQPDYGLAHRRNLEILMIADPAKVDDTAVWIQSRNAERTRGLSRPISVTGSLAKQLPRLSQPLAFIWGEKDATARGYLEERRRFLHATVPRAGFTIVPGAGHWLQYEDPDGFERALREHVVFPGEQGSACR